jgi:hypothetical protein
MTQAAARRRKAPERQVLRSNTESEHCQAFFVP